MTSAERIILLVGILLGTSIIVVASRQSSSGGSTKQKGFLPAIQDVLDLTPAPSDTPPATQPAPTVDEWKTYRNDEYGYSIDYAGTIRFWPQSDGRTNVELGIFSDHRLANDAIGSEGEIGIVVFPGKLIPSYGISDKDLLTVDEHIAATIAPTPAGSCVEDTTELASIPTRRLSCSAGSRPVVNHYLEHGDNLFLIAVNSAIITADGRDPAPIVERMLASFRFES